jgi:hypothetical protein
MNALKLERRMSQLGALKNNYCVPCLDEVQWGQISHARGFQSAANTSSPLRRSGGRAGAPTCSRLKAHGKT